MDVVKSIFQRKKVVPDALEPFGFTRGEAAYTYTKELPGSGFQMTVTVSAEGEVSARVVDPAFNEPYTLHLASDAAGSFVGEVKQAYEALLSEISERCFERDVFKSAQAKKLIAYVRGVYGDELEYLWEKFPDNAVWRRKDNRKWYGALLCVSKRKLGIESDEYAEIIDLRGGADEMETLVDGKTFFPGWHMNKKTWYTALLDGSVPDDALCRRIDASRALATK